MLQNNKKSGANKSKEDQRRIFRDEQLFMAEIGMATVRHRFGTVEHHL